MVEIKAQVQTAIIEAAQKRAPLEACGIMAGLDGVFFAVRELENEAEDPANGFQIDPKDFLAEKAAYDGFELALWHSHPRSRAIPSPPDQVLMMETKLLMVIVSLYPHLKVAAFRWDERDQRPIEVCKYRLEGVRV